MDHHNYSHIHSPSPFFFGGSSSSFGSLGTTDAVGCAVLAVTATTNPSHNKSWRTRSNPRRKRKRLAAGGGGTQQGAPVEAYNRRALFGDSVASRNSKRSRLALVLSSSLLSTDGGGRGRDSCCPYSERSVSKPLSLSLLGTLLSTNLFAAADQHSKAQHCSAVVCSPRQIPLRKNAPVCLMERTDGSVF